MNANVETPANFRSLTPLEQILVSGGNDEEEENGTSENVIIVEAPRSSDGGGGGASGGALPFFFFSNGSGSDGNSGLDSFSDDITFVSDNELSDQDEQQIADFLNGLLAGLDDLIDQYGDFELTLKEGDTIKASELVSAFGHTLNLIEGGNLLTAAATGNPFVADTAGFIASLGVAGGLTVAGAGPITVLVAATATGALTALVVDALIDRYGDNLQAGIDRFNAAATDTVNQTFGIDPNDSTLDQLRDFMDSFGPSLPFDIRDMFIQEISYREGSDGDGDGGITPPAPIQA